MERFNTTKKGYRFDKIIFWMATLIIIGVFAGIAIKEGITYKPYFKCEGNLISKLCTNPFYDKNSYGCTLAFGKIKCNIEEYEWMSQPILPVGEYGTPPKNYNGFYLMMFSIYLLAFMLNHFLWNRTKKFHINIFEYLNKIDQENE